MLALAVTLSPREPGSGDRTELPFQVRNSIQRPDYTQAFMFD